MLFFKHVLKVFSSRFVLVIALGVIMALSSFLFTMMSDAVHAIEHPTEAYFAEYKQEDFAFEMLPYPLPSEISEHSDVCANDAFTTLSALSESNRACFDAIINSRLSYLENNHHVSVSMRYFKDTTHSLEGRNRVRILKAMNTMNVTFLEEGALPEEDGEIAILSNYASYNNLSLGDEMTLGNETFVITGFVLFPDYSLPIIENMFMFDSHYQTLALLTDSQFEAFEQELQFTGAGLIEASDFDIRIFMDAEFVIEAVMTEHNLRSGAIYTELTASQAMALFMSVLIAGIGVVITAILMAKTLEQNRQSIGILKALGLSSSRVMIPYLGFIAVFSLVFLTAGYALGFLAASPLKAMFVSFYLLPSEAVSFNPSTLLIALFVPFIFLTSISAFILHRLLSQAVVSLITHSKDDVKKVRFQTLRKKLMAFDVTLRVQLAFISRHMVKVSVYFVGVFTALMLIYVSFSMVGLFDRTMNDYYNTQTMDYIGYCPLLEPCDVDRGEAVIEMNAIIDGRRVNVIAFDPKDSHLFLPSRRNEELRDLVKDGMVVSRSYQLLSGYETNDTVEMMLFNDTHAVTVVAVTHLFPGDYVYMHIDTLREFLGLEDFYNAVYSKDALDEDAFMHVVYINDILQQVDSMNELVQWMIRIILISAMAMGAIIIYVLTVMLVEDYFYPIALFKVMGYNDADIHKMLLGGYSKLNIVIFLISVPLGFLALHSMSVFFADMFDFVIPLTLTIFQVLFALIMLLVMYYVGSYVAKKKIAKVSLQEALKRYQN